VGIAGPPEGGCFGGFRKNPPSTVEVTGFIYGSLSREKRSFIVETEQGTDNQNLETAPPASESAFSEKAIETISGLRTRAQAAEMRAERAEGISEGLQKAATKEAPPVKSPLQLRAEQDGVGIEEVQMDGALYQAQKRHDDQVANQAAAKKAKTDADATISKSMAAAKLKNADWESVVTVGQEHLTLLELNAIENAGMDYGKKAYDLCKKAAERAKPKTETPAPEKKPGEPEDKTTQKKPEPLTQQEILDAVGDADPNTRAVMEL
jgi:hypothetical protein